MDEDEGRELEGGGGPPCARAAAAGDGDSWRWRFFTFVAFTHARPSWTLARCQPQLTSSPEEGPAMLQEAGKNSNADSNAKQYRKRGLNQLATVTLRRYFVL